MFLKFLKTNKQYEFTSGGYNVDAEKVRFDSADIPAVDGGFIVINDEGIEVDYTKYAVVYEKTADYITFTSDKNVYSTFLVFDDKTGYVTSQITTTDKEVANGILQKKGQGKAFQDVESMNLLDEDGFYIYKVVDGVVVKTTKQDKKPFTDEKNASELDAARAAKLQEISAACSAAIEAGVDFNGDHFSYNNDDQKNISSMVTLAQTTGLNVPYHADGQSCRLFTPAEVVGLYIAEETNLTGHITYHNQLKLFVESLSTKAEIDEVVYGQPLTGKYLDTYNVIMAQAEAIVKKFSGQ